MQNKIQDLTPDTIHECVDCGWIGKHKDKSTRKDDIFTTDICLSCGCESFQLPDCSDDDELDFEFNPCSECDGHPACEEFGCAFKLVLGHLVNKQI